MDAAVSAVEWDSVATARHSCTADVVLWRGATGSGDILEAAGSLEMAHLLLQACRDDGIGLLVGVCPWGFEMVTSKSVKRCCAQNWLLRQVGLAFSADTYKPVAGQDGEAIPAALQRRAPSNADADVSSAASIDARLLDDQTHAAVVLRRLAAAGFEATTPITKTDANVLLSAVNTLAG